MGPNLRRAANFDRRVAAAAADLRCAPLACPCSTPGCLGIHGELQGFRASGPICPSARQLTALEPAESIKRCCPARPLGNHQDFHFHLKSQMHWPARQGPGSRVCHGLQSAALVPRISWAFSTCSSFMQGQATMAAVIEPGPSKGIPSALPGLIEPHGRWVSPGLSLVRQQVGTLP